MSKKEMPDGVSPYDSPLMGNVILRANDGGVFYCSIFQLCKFSDVLTSALEDITDLYDEITLDHSTEHVMLWLDTFHDRLGYKASTTKVEEYLHILMPLYFEYNMEHLLNKCYSVIKNTRITDEIATMIFSGNQFKRLESRVIIEAPEASAPPAYEK
jgi:hypothetical protein